MEKKRIYILIVEDDQLAKDLVHTHFDNKKITFAQTVLEENREQVVDALNDID